MSVGAPTSIGDTNGIQRSSSSTRSATSAAIDASSSVQRCVLRCNGALGERQVLFWPATRCSWFLGLSLSRDEGRGGRVDASFHRRPSINAASIEGG